MGSTLDDYFADLPPHQPLPGDLVCFWTGRGSHGYADVREVRDGRYILAPHPSATKGSDYRPARPGRPEYWSVRSRGVPLTQLTDPPQIWFHNF